MHILMVNTFLFSLTFNLIRFFLYLLLLFLFPLKAVINKVAGGVSGGVGKNLNLAIVS